MASFPRFFVTGTDTDVGKTTVAAALACALRRSLHATVPVTVVKLVQTGVHAGEEGDAARAARLARSSAGRYDDLIDARELRRYAAAADGYTAARAAGAVPPSAAELAGELAELDGALVIEGLGGAATPINAEESIAHVAAHAGLDALVVVGLRLGCINHALLTTSFLRSLDVAIAGAVLVERWQPLDARYRDDVARCLARSTPIVAAIAHGDPAPVAQAVDALSGLVARRWASV